MPLYELFCIAAAARESAPLRDLVRSTSRLVLDNGGAVRGVQYWGKRVLPQRTRRHQQYYTEGDYFLLHIDTSPPVLSALTTRLRADPRVIRHTALKLGERLTDIVPPNLSGGKMEMSGSVPDLKGSANDELLADYAAKKSIFGERTIRAGTSMKHQ